MSLRSWLQRRRPRRAEKRRDGPATEPVDSPMVEESTVQATGAEARIGTETAPVAAVGGQAGADGRWRAVACSVAGTSHVETGRPCDDVSVVAEVGATTLLVASDGAGSARLARRGATVAVAASVEAAVGFLAAGEAPVDPEGWERLLEDCLRAARGALDDCREPPADLACTLLIAILRGETLAAVRVGDGWVVAQDRAGGVRAVLPPEKGEYFNETFFVSSDRFLERAAFRIEPASDLTAVAVLTDGLEMVACDLSAMQPTQEFFEPLFAFVRDAPLSASAKRRELEALLRSSRVNRKTDDDKTIAVAVRGSGRAVSA